MKFKTTAIAMAIAGITAVPVVAQADIGAYASIRHGLISKDTGDGADSSINFQNRGSRIGFKGETDLGNGLTAFGKYEWGVNSESNNNVAESDPAASQSSLGSTRHGIVGLKGDFGSVTLGQTYHTYYNFVNGPVDIANWNSGFYSVGRTGEAVSYAGDFGAVSVGATGYFRTDHTKFDNDMNGTEIAVGFDAGPVVIGVGVKSDSEAEGLAAIEDRTGLAVSGTFSDIYLALSAQSQDPNDSVEISASFMQFYLAYGQIDNGDNTRTDLTLGYSLPIGENTNAWFEYYTKDLDNGTDSDDSLEFILKYNWN
jgi:predicted porin